MINLVEKFTPASDDASSDEGVVTIEYVLVAVAIAGIIGAGLFTGVFADAKSKLDALIPVP